MTETQKRHVNPSAAMERELQEHACRCQEEAGRTHNDCLAEARCVVRQQMGRQVMSRPSQRRPVTGMHEYGIHSSTLGHTTWIAPSSKAARIGIINQEGVHNLGKLTIRRIRSNVTDEPTATERVSTHELEAQMRALLEADTSGRAKNE